MTYYRTYRPQTVATLDLTGVREALERIIASGQFSQAYLFTGPKGTGKTSSARILAKALNCEKNSGKIGEPCNVCKTCKAITNGSSLAVMELDGASNRGIDDIRLLRDRVALSPADAPYAVYVIDEVHMLTTEAFNALLKTLEEPPKHAVFVLCTTELHKVPQTIVSRCALVAFTKATVPEIIQSLKKAVGGEKLNISPQALEKIAERVDGSFRDGMKILEQLAQFGREITVKDVDALTGYTEDYDPTSLITAFTDHDMEAGLAELKHRNEAGVDMGLYGKRLVEVLRERLLSRVTAVKRKEEEIRGMIAMIDLITAAVLNMKTAVVASLPLEMAVVEWCLGAPKETHNTPETPLRNITLNVAKTPKPKIEEKMGVPLSISIDEIKSKWTEIMRAVRPYNHSLEALLRAARPLEIDGDRLVIEVFYTFHKEQLELERHMQVIEKVMLAVCNNPVKLKFILGSKAKKALVTAGSGVANVTGTVTDDSMVEAVEEIFGK